MIHHPVHLVIFLLSIEVAVLWTSSQERFKRYFGFLPGVFWIYFLPMLASTFGIIDSKSPLCSAIATNLLPASLLLLLISVDIKAIVRLGGPALIMFFAGSAGIILGAPLVFFFFKGIVGAETWSGFGALAASWTGGSANMIAVKEATGTPDSVFLPMVVVDTVVPYVWMGMLVALAGIQPWFDRQNRSDRKILDELSRKISNSCGAKVPRLEFQSIGLVLALAVAGTMLARETAKFLPVLKDVISAYAWTIIVVSTLGIVLSFTSVRKLEARGSTRLGYFLLYFVLTSIGAKANISNLGSALVLILAGFLIVFFHAGILVVTARLMRAPLFLVAVASQANIGGVASAPIVAEIYQPGFASVGLLLAILGNIVGTYFGIITGQLCRMVGFLN